METEGLCAFSLLINVVAALVGNKAATMMHNEWGKLKPKICSLADLTHLIQGVKFWWPVDSIKDIREIQLQRVPKVSMENFYEVRFEWLANQKEYGSFACKLMENFTMQLLLIV